MRLLMSVAYLGGAGGMERALQSISKALRDHDLHVVYGRRVGGPFSRLDGTVRADPVTRWRWRGGLGGGALAGGITEHLVNPPRRTLTRGYDAYIALSPHAPAIGSAARTRTRMLVPAGSPTALARERFDVVAMESPDNDHLLADGERRVLLTPPLTPLAEQVDPVPVRGLPAEFFLTVFNPYTAVKGLDDLHSAVDSLPLPLVWCFSRATLDFAIPGWAVDSSKIVLVEDATPEQIRGLYQQCSAYLGFSTREGFGWALADALMEAPAVVSRPVGILSYPQALQPGVFLVDGEGRWSFDFSRLEAGPPAARDLSWAAAETYPDRVERALKAAGGMTAPRFS